MAGAAQRLKQLQTQLHAAIDAHQIKKAELQQIQAEEIFAYDKLKKIQAEMASLQDGERDLIVTEHAYIRYFERVLGYDLDKVKEEIMPKVYRDRFLKAKFANHRVEDSHVCVIKDGKILTVFLPHNEPPKIREIVEDESTEGYLSDIMVIDEDSEGGGGASLQT